MKARLQKFFNELSESFWLIPSLMASCSVLGALGCIKLDRSDAMPQWIFAWLYDGGATGARTLLGTVAASSIGVAGTVFSITIAALSLAAGQMGPRLLRNFTRDRGNQVTLGAFLGTFSYALIVLRSVRTQSEGQFVPHLSLTISIVLALVCVATLVFFVNHMAGRINVDTVIGLVSDDIRRAIRRLTTDERPSRRPPEIIWRDATMITDKRRGYLQQLDESGLARWAGDHHVTIDLLVRPGDYVFPGAPIACITRETEGAAAAIRNATALGSHRVGAQDLEFAVRQLVEVAVRALSPGINDPHTAISVLDRLGAALCEIVGLNLRSGVTLQDGQPALLVPAIDYDGLTNTMFHMIRQNGAGTPAVLIRIIEVLIAVASADREPSRLATLQRHADLVLGDAERDVRTPADLADIRERHRVFEQVRADASACFAGGRA